MEHTRRAQGHLIRVFRGARKLSITKLAEKAGVSKEYLSRVERGERGSPSEELTRRLADALEVAPEYLTGQLPPYRAIRKIVSTMSPEEFAASLGITRAELDAIECGAITPNEYLVGSMAARLGLYAKDLVPEIHEIPPSPDHPLDRPPSTDQATPAG